MQPGAPSDATNATDQPARPVVLFDGGCPMCSREIAHYRRLKAAAMVDWVDITQSTDLRAQFGISADTAMARFHVRDADGSWQTGAAGFVELWSHLGAYRWLGRAVTLLHLTPLLEWAYVRFAGWRQRKRCQDTACVASDSQDNATR